MNKAGQSIRVGKYKFPPPTHTRTNEVTLNFRGVFDLRKMCRWLVNIVAHWQWTQFSPWKALHFGYVGPTQHNMGIVLLSRAIMYYGPDHMGQLWSNHIWLRASGLDNVDLFIKDEWF